MIDWLKRIFQGKQQSATPSLFAVTPPLPKPTKPVQPCSSPSETEVIQQPPAASFSITFSASGPDKREANFRSHELAKLWQQVCSISHPDHPFLDPVYSPGSLMPVADFTQWIAERLSYGDWDSIAELLDFIATEHQITALRRTFQSYNFSRFIEADPSVLLELQAIAILIYRIQWSGHEDGRTSLLAELLGQSLACVQFAVREESIPHLLEGANKFIRRQNTEFKEVRPPEPLLKSVDLISNLPEISSVGKALGDYPVTFRSCISYSLYRGSPVPGTIRPQLQGDYGLRQFGLSGSQNSQWFAQCGIFEAPSDLSVLAGSFTKDELQEIAVSHGVEITKSWKKDRIIVTLMGSTSARAAIAAKAAEGIMQIRIDITPEFDAWSARLKAVKNIALCLAHA